MCNLYSYTKPQDAARKLAHVERDIVGNMPLLPAIFPDKLAPVVRRCTRNMDECADQRCRLLGMEQCHLLPVRLIALLVDNFIPEIIDRCTPASSGSSAKMARRRSHQGQFDLGLQPLQLGTRRTSSYHAGAKRLKNWQSCAPYSGEIISVLKARHKLKALKL
jgi:hypothetical protein